MRQTDVVVWLNTFVVIACSKMDQTVGTEPGSIDLSRLFWTDDQIETFQTKVLQGNLPLYRLDSSKTRVSAVVPCGSSETLNVRAASACGTTDTYTCCQTTMQLIQPTTVTGLLDHRKYNVTSTVDGVQILHIGTCSSEGQACSVGGVCHQENRISWVLVTTGEFIPVEVPNHCVCVFT
ncbi:uncharacterized protein LOC125384451 [Haliotis rufescens]|uniref:uncharacterized protein LOC125384451 n=1 Tax=Haliotis rufescens TaxID=6454 RepID=UPI00201F3074|nr:uncharacterized protein LOC125384451 [Haliotis rufescens]